MKPYWESKLTVKKAQDLSEDGEFFSHTTICRIIVVAILLITLVCYPLYFIITYCALSYAVIGYLLITGELSSQIAKGFFIWLLSPVSFVLISFIKPPIL